MGCMNSKEDGSISGGESPTSESQRPLLNSEGGNVWSNYQGGVAVISNEQNDERNGLHMSETQVGGSPHFRSALRDQGFAAISNQPVARFEQSSNYHSASEGGADSGDGVMSVRGREIMNNLKKAYEWHTRFETPTQEFLSLMDRLYMECQVHLSNLSSKGDPESKNEADVIVAEMVAVRNRWGTRLLPNSICNAFVRERIPHIVEGRQFRIDCAQFFEPVPFYGSQQTDNPGELMKMYRFSVYDLTRNEVVLRYYLERSNVTQLYHVLCFTCDNYRGQVIPYGSECPSYWEVRRHMMDDLLVRLKSSNAPNLISTNYPSHQGGPVIIQIP